MIHRQERSKHTIRSRLGVGLLLATSAVGGGCGLVLDYGDYGPAQGQGGATTTASGGGGQAPQGGGGSSSCPGCSGVDGCEPGNAVTACGSDGAQCDDCSDDNPCTANTCGGGCVSKPLDGACPGGVCQNGVCTALAEDCTNGVDDNADGKIDCADPICTGATFGCEPTQSGWTGPVAAYVGSSPPSCGGVFTELVFSGKTNLSADDATCSACTCPPSGSCGNADVSFVANAAGDPCVASACEQNVLTVPSSGACTAAVSCTTSAAVEAVFDATLGAGNAACAPSQQSPTIPPAAWDDVVVCAQPALGAGCGANEGCVAVPPPPLSPKLCLVHADVMDCPAGPYSQKTVAYGSTADDRGCTACSCGSPTCSGTLTVYDNIGCNTNFDTVALPLAACTNMGQKYSDFSASLAVSHACVPSMATPTGSFSGSAATTICCVP